MGKTKQYLVLAVIMLGGIVAIAFLEDHLAEEFTACVRVIDGDTLRVCDKDVSIRLRGIDAPELAQTCELASKSQPCGRTAREHLRQIIGKRDAHCRTTGTDQYDRLLAICEIGGQDVGERMVADGWAISLGAYFPAEKKARELRKGLWAGRFLPPREWRQQNPRVQTK